MKVPQFIAASLFAVALALEAWTLQEVVNLKIQVAEIKMAITTYKIASNNH